MSTPKLNPHWGHPPWTVDFTPAAPRAVPKKIDFAIVGGGFTGLAAAAWLRLLAPEKSVAVFEAFRIGAGASGRTGGMALAEAASGDLPGLGDVLAQFSAILKKLGVECDLALDGAWEIARTGGPPHSPIEWTDSGTLRVVNEVPGGTLDPGKLVGGLAHAAQRMGVEIWEDTSVEQIRWAARPELEWSSANGRRGKISAAKVLLATNASALPLTQLGEGAHPRLTLAAATAPLTGAQIAAAGLAQRKPFYTVDFPYLWGRLRRDNSIVWGAGLVSAPAGGDLSQLDIAAGEPARLFASLERRVRHLHPAFETVNFTHRWGGPILFRENWQPVFGWHAQSPNAIVLGAYAGHGVALSVFLGSWAAEALLGRRDLPDWGRILL